MTTDQAKEINEAEITKQDDEDLLLSLNDYIGDNGELQDTDWELSGEDISLLERIKQLPYLEANHQLVNQYQNHRRWETACTWISGLNSVFTNMGKELTQEAIDKGEALAIKRGRVPGRGWTRGAGMDIGRIIYNEMFPDNPCHTFLVGIDSPEAIAYLSTGRVMNVSITVDGRFWSQVLTHRRLLNTDFGPGGGHATIFKGEGDKLFLDSVGRRGDVRGTEYVVTVPQIDIKKNRIYTLRKDAHIVLPVNIIPMIASDVPNNQRYSEAIKKIIESGIMTKDKDNKFNPHQPLTRAMMAQILSNLDEKGIIKL